MFRIDNHVIIKGIKSIWWSTKGYSVIFLVCEFDCTTTDLNFKKMKPVSTCTPN